MKLTHPALVDLLKKAYSAEKAAAFAYQGHAGSVKNIEEKKAIRHHNHFIYRHVSLLITIPRIRNGSITSGMQNPQMQT